MAELIDKKTIRKNNRIYYLGAFDYILIIVYAFLSSFEAYLDFSKIFHVSFFANITKFIMLLIICVFVIKDLFRKRLRPSILLGFLLVWFGLKCISIFVGRYNDIVKLHYISQIGFVLFVIPFLTHEFNEKDSKRILFIFWFVSFVFNILSVFLSKPYLGTYTSRRVLTLLGRQNDPNNCAAISILSVAISAYCLFHKNKYYILNILSILFGSFAIAVSGSRAGLLTLAFVLLIAFFARKANSLSTYAFRIATAFVFVSVGLIAAINFLEPETLKRLFNNADGGSGRLTLWYKAFALFSSKPLFGAGWGTATYYAKLFPQAVHNTFISMLAENGIVGLTLFLAPFVISIIWSIKNRNLLPLLIAFSALISAFFVDSINKRFIWNSLIFVYLIMNTRIQNTYQGAKSIMVCSGTVKIRYLEVTI